MKATFKITKASDWNFRENKTFETLKELRDYVISNNEKGSACVIDWDTMELTIYDDWIE